MVCYSDPYCITVFKSFLLGYFICLKLQGNGDDSDCKVGICWVLLDKTLKKYSIKMYSSLWNRLIGRNEDCLNSGQPSGMIVCKNGVKIVKKKNSECNIYCS